MSAPAPAKPTKVETLPLEEQIRRRAYELYAQRGDQPGSALQDWLRAEQEILQARQDTLVDQASEESFPSSDAPAY